MSLDAIQADFDKIARLVADEPDGPDRYESFLLAQLPTPCGKVLEIGCGTGRLARAIEGRGAAVTAIDLSPEMIRLACRRTREGARIEFVCGDVLNLAMEPATHDAVLSAATLHHLPTEKALSRMRSLLKPGGTLLIHDIRAPSGVVDWLRSALVASLNGDALWWVRHRFRQGRALREAWREHGTEERYLTWEGIQSLCGMLPGSQSYWHPLWRYTVVWTRENAVE